MKHDNNIPVLVNKNDQLQREEWWCDIIRSIFITQYYIKNKIDSLKD